jgi:hypothetical protein
MTKAKAIRQELALGKELIQLIAQELEKTQKQVQAWA